MKVSVLGGGRWGSLLAWVQNQQGREVVLWNRSDDILKAWLKKRKNKYLRLPKEVLITDDLNKALESNFIFIAIRAQYFRDLCQLLAKHQPKGKTFILAMKGIEDDSGKLLSEIFEEYFNSENKLAILAGPGHPQEITKNIPTVMTIAGRDSNLSAELAKELQTDLMKLLPNDDFIGVETGAAMKNVIGLAGGLLEALGKKSFKSYLLARGPVETGRLIKVLGGDARTAFGLSHLGDYGATVFAGISHNHQAGELWVKKHKLATNAEGVPTLQAVKLLIDKYNLDMPICSLLYKIFYENYPVEKFIPDLLAREGDEDLS